MEIAVPDLAGSLGGGGRYDGLIGMFSGEDVPACGFSLGLERILVVMGERGMFPPDDVAAAADVLVPLFDADTSRDALALAGELRAAGCASRSIPSPTSSASR
jgi:histidyl-tRNA synthetase